MNHQFVQMQSRERIGSMMNEAANERLARQAPRNPGLLSGMGAQIRSAYRQFVHSLNVAVRPALQPKDSPKQ